MSADVVFVHAPSIYDFREKPVMFGPVSDVVPSTPVFEMYPIGFAVLAGYLESRGYRARIANVALRMLMSKRFDVRSYIRSLKAHLFAIDLHWLPHVQGALEVARIIKEEHPRTPVVFGGLSSSYYHRELIQYPFVDMVLKGDSTEEPLRMLVDAIKAGGDLSEVPNLTWKDADGTVYCQPITYVPEVWNHSRINYGRIIKMVLRDRDIKGYLPFKDFLRYPIVASFMCRGGFRDCSICGGSRYAYRAFYGRRQPAVREPEVLADDIADAARYFNGPIFLVGDIQAPGEDYARRFLRRLAASKIDNMVAFEFWKLPGEDLFAEIGRALKNWSFEISCESQDFYVRKKFGKAVFTNEQFRDALIAGFKAGAQRGDVYFMTGIPFQTYESILGIADFVDWLYRSMNGYRNRLACFVAPLAPFVDPGSLAFEKPEFYGYRINARTLEEHKRNILQPSWKYWMNYESKYLSRDELVEATYKCALRLNEIKRKHGAVKPDDARRVELNIKNAMTVMNRVDEIYHAPLSDSEKQQKYALLSADMVRYSLSTVCEKKELEWSVPALRKFKIRNIIRALAI